MSLPNESMLSADTPSSHDSIIPQLSRKFVARRTSEGETGRLKEELKCQACGKGYKHVSSLAKHLWEHTPEWNVASKLLISKHQKVQLLEAASIIVSMNEEDKDDFTSEGFIRDKSESVSEPADGSTPGSTSGTTPSDDAGASSDSEDRASHSSTPPESPLPTRRGSIAEVPVTTPRTIQKPSSRARRFSLSESPAINSLMSVAAAASPLPDSWVKDDDLVSHRRNRRRSTLLRIPDNDDQEIPERLAIREMKEEEDRGVFESEP